MRSGKRNWNWSSPAPSIGCGGHMNGCGHVKHKKFCSEDCAMEAHDQAHEDPEDWADECTICEKKLKED